MKKNNFRVQPISLEGAFFGLDLFQSKLKNIIEKELWSIHEITIDHDKKVLKAENERRQKALKCLEKCSSLLEKEFDDKVYRNLTEYDLIKNNVQILIGYFKENLQANRKSIYHDFQNSNLFITSLYLYGLINKKNNDDWLLGALAPGKYKIKISKIILNALSEIDKASDVNSNLPTINIKTYPKIKRRGRFLPSYSEVKKLSGYKAELQRTLLNNKLIHFKTRNDLQLISDYILDEANSNIIDSFFYFRYEWMIEKPEKKVTIKLSKDQKKIILFHEKQANPIATIPINFSSDV